MIKKLIPVLILILFFNCKETVKKSETNPTKRGLVTDKAMVVSARKEASKIGTEIMKLGGNAFDAMMATEMALKFNDKIRVNAIAPGFFIGNQNRALLTNDDGSYTERGHVIIQNTPMKRFGNADELNGTIHWLISDAASFVTGTITPIDGGFSAFSGV